MSFSIQGTPVQINLLFVPLDGMPPPAPHPLGAPSEALLLDLILGLLPQDAGAALSQLLSGPVDYYFDQAWAGLQVGAQSMVNEAIVGAIGNAYNVNTALPPKGSLVADVGGLSAVMQETLPAGIPGTQLTFRYLLPGVQVSFSETTGGIWGSWADPNYNLTFDLALEIAVAVPAKAAIPFGTKAQLLVTNMQAGPSNLYALIGGLEDLIGAFLSGQPGGQGAALSDRIIGIYLAQLSQLFTQLSTGFAVASSNGFSELAVKVNTNPPADTLPDGVTPGNQVEFGLTVPFVRIRPPVNANLTTGPILLTPQLEVSATQVNAGATIGVVGTRFPPAQSSQITISWDDVQDSSGQDGSPLPGAIVQSEVQWGVATAGGGAPVAGTESDAKIPRGGTYDGANIYTAKGLVPNTAYAFHVRDLYIQNFLSTDWSLWETFSTTASDAVQLLLDNTVVGTATLQPDGSFTASIAVPSGTAPGTYPLWAVLAGERMAEAALTVIDANQPQSPVLEIVDPQTGYPTNGSTVAFEGAQIIVRGVNFLPGTVFLFLDSPSGASLGKTHADLAGSFDPVTLTLPPDVFGIHKIHAQQPKAQADVPLTIVLLPK